MLRHVSNQVLACWTRSVLAQPVPFPVRPIRFIVPSPPGGGTDGFARLLADKLSESARWQLVVENVPGDGGNTGLDAAIRSAADGHTMVMGESANLTINRFLRAKPAFDPATDLAPVVLVARVPLVFVVSAAGRLDSYTALLGEGTRRVLRFASGGVGTVGHLVGESWRRVVGVPIEHTAYRGGAAAVAEVAGGKADFHIASVLAAMGPIRSGKVKALAVTSFARSALLPDVPSLVELRLANFDAHVVYGVLVPVRTSTAIIDSLSSEISRVLKQPGVRQELAKMGADRTIFGGTPAQFGDFLWYDRRRRARAVSDSGVIAKKTRCANAVNRPGQGRFVYRRLRLLRCARQGAARSAGGVRDRWQRAGAVRRVAVRQTRHRRHRDQLQGRRGVFQRADGRRRASSAGRSAPPGQGQLTTQVVQSGGKGCRRARNSGPPLRRIAACQSRRRDRSLRIEPTRSRRAAPGRPR